MDAPTLDLNFRRCGVKALVFHYPELAAVHSVGFCGSELIRIKMQSSLADFLIRRKCDRDGPVADLRVLAVILKHVHDLGDARLVIRPQKSSAVSRDQSLSVMQSELRKLILPKERIVSLEVLNEPGLYIRAGRGWRRIQMRYEAERLSLTFKFCIYITVIPVIYNIFRPEFDKFRDQQSRQVMLFHGAWTCRALLAALGVDCNIVKESVDQVFCHYAYASKLFLSVSGAVRSVRCASALSRKKKDVLGRTPLSGEDGIRTHAPVRTNGFQDRLVMTASIPLHICCLRQLNYYNKACAKKQPQNQIFRSSGVVILILL